MKKLLSIFKRRAEKPQITHKVWYIYLFENKKFYFQYNAKKEVQKGLLVEHNTKFEKLSIEQVSIRVDKNKCSIVPTKIVEKFVVIYMRRKFDYRQGDTLTRPFKNLAKSIVLLKNSFIFVPKTCTLRCGNYIVMQDFVWSKK